MDLSNLKAVSFMEKPLLSAKAYFLQQHNLCCKYLRAYNQRKSTKNLHQLRVSIKKIRALLKMLNKLEPDFEYRKNFSAYRNIFRKAGTIREESLHVEKLKDDGSHKSKPTSARAIAKLSNELIKSTPAFLKSVAGVKVSIAESFNKLDQKQILPYCKKVFRQLISKWVEVKSEEDLHAFRKKLKQFLYCSTLLSIEEKAQMASVKKYNRLDELQDIIGKWHDNVLLLNKISEDKLKVDDRFLFSLKHQTHQLLSKAHKKGNKL